MKNLRLFTGGAIKPRASIRFHHSGGECSYSAFEVADNIKIILSVPRALGVISATVDVMNESCDKTIATLTGVWYGISFGCDEYVFETRAENIGVGLFFLRFSVRGAFGTRFGRRCGENLIFDTDSSSRELPQLTVADFKYPSPEGLYGGVIYHVFVDRFCRGGESEIPDGAVLADFSHGIPEYPDFPGAPLKNNTFYGGTLDGIVGKLDYLCSLGVTLLYLSPVFKSPSNHKYDTADYMSVDPIFGGDSALLRLIAAARGRGIRIILDGVFNHTGSDSIYFNKYGRYDTLGAYQSKDSPYYSWYDFKEYPDKYTSWWDIEILPRINPDKPECRRYFVGDGGVIDKYLSYGIYGLRLDVADELSDDFIAEIKKTLSAHGESVLYGEVWEDASNKIAYGKRKRYYQGAELDGVMNYPLRRGIIDYITRAETDALRFALTDVISNAPKRIRDAQMNLLGTHDTARILTALGGESCEGKSNEYLSKKRMSPKVRALAIKRLKAAYTVITTLPGIPTVYYGDEAGLEGYSDPFNRMPYPWGKEEEDLVAHYKKMGQIRKDCDVYRNGEFKLHILERDLLLFSRYKDNDAYLTVYNNSDSRIKIDFDTPAFSLSSRETDSSFVLSPLEAKIFVSSVGCGVKLKKHL